MATLLVTAPFADHGPLWETLTGLNFIAGQTYMLPAVLPFEVVFHLNFVIVS